MNPGVYSFLGLVVFGLVAAGYQALRRSAARKRIQRIPITAISALPAEETRVRVAGIARAIDGETTSSWYSGKTGLAILFEAWTHVGGQRGSRGEKRVHVARFRVEDETGAIEIDPEHVDLLLGTSPATRSTTESRRGFGASLQAQVDTVEGFVQDGDRISVAGLLVRTPDGARRLTGTAKAPVVICDGKPGA